MKVFNFITLLGLQFFCIYVTCQGTTLKYEMFEDSGADTFVGNVKGDAGLDSSYNYKFVDNNLMYAQYFILSSSGILTTTTRVDRESIDSCRNMEICTLDLDVAATSSTDSSDIKALIRVSITIKDLNDNPPVFSEPSYEIAIRENTAIGFSIALPTATDPDSPDYSVSRYELITGSPTFSLTSKQDGTTWRVFLVLEEELDRETQAMYPVTVAAFDGNTNSHSGTANINVRVIDINDNTPRFNSATYETTISEATRPGTQFMSVTATDKDSGINGQIIYGFTADTMDQVGDMFGIDNATGAISVVGPLSYPPKGYFVLTVTAKDSDPYSIEVSQRVTIHIQDVNDHDPVIKIRNSTHNGRVEISENSLPDSFVVLVSVHDEDPGENGKFNCSIDKSSFRLVNIFDGNDYTIKTATQLDREENASYDIKFVCQDHGSPARTSTMIIPVSVLDDNDSDPVFTKQTYSVLMSESSLIGSSVTRVNASDEDAGNNSILEYRPVASAAEYLNIDPATGEVTLRRTLDYETQQKHTFRVIATDHGVPQRTATATILITVLDADDEVPEFKFPADNVDNKYHFFVHEKLYIRAEIDRVTAVDRDSSPNNQFEYALSPNSYPELFYINPEDGTLYTHISLDREKQDRYELTVYAITKSTPAKTSSAQVIVKVLDVNDHSPSWVFPRENNNTVYVSSNAAKHSLITTILAVDLDQGINAEIIYELVNSSAAKLFDLNRNTGELSVKHDMTNLVDKMVNLTIRASDKGDEPTRVETVLHVVVNQSTEPPLKSSQNLTIVISVAVVSGVLSVILIIAICIMCRKTVHDSKMGCKAHNNSDQNVLIEGKLVQPANSMARNPSHRSTTGSWHNPKEISFGDDTTDNSSVQFPKTNNHVYRQNSSTIRPTDPQNIQHMQMTHYAPRPTQMSVYYQNEMQIPHHDDVYAGRDSDSAGSGSVPDSGRGSNDDGDSRKSPMEMSKDPTLSPIPETPRRLSSTLPAEQIHTRDPHKESFSSRPSTSGIHHTEPRSLSYRVPGNSFTERLQKVVNAKNDHAKDLEHDIYSKPHPHRVSNPRHVKPPVLPEGYSDTIEQNPPAIPPKHNLNNSNSQSKKMLSNKTIPEPNGNRDSYYKSDDTASVNAETSGTEWSDEEKEYVYYLNSESSHV